MESIESIKTFLNEYSEATEVFNFLGCFEIGLSYDSIKALSYGSKKALNIEKQLPALERSGLLEST